MEIVHQNEKNFLFYIVSACNLGYLITFVIFYYSFFYNFVPEIKSLIIYLWNAN